MIYQKFDIYTFNSLFHIVLSLVQHDTMEVTEQDCSQLTKCIWWRDEMHEK
jgi:hypothetical protein